MFIVFIDENIALKQLGDSMTSFGSEKHRFDSGQRIN